MADQATRRLKIFQDEVKLRHTSHWDMDTMSRSELDAYMSAEHQPVGTVTHDTPTTLPAAVPESAWSRFLKTILPVR